MPDLSSQDLGNGFKLVFQRGSSSQIRAVVKDASGTIVARGPVVNEAQYKLTQFKAVQEWNLQQHPHMAETASFEPLDEDGDDQAERDAAEQPENANKWTVMGDGVDSSGQPCRVYCCAHCDHEYGQAFDYNAIVVHCRQEHREFYKKKWNEEIIPSGQAATHPDWAPIGWKGSI